MSISTVCPSCAKSLNIPDKYAALAVKCPACKGVVKVPAMATPIRAEIVPVTPRTAIQEPLALTPSFIQPMQLVPQAAPQVIVVERIQYVEVQRPAEPFGFDQRQAPLAQQNVTVHVHQPHQKPSNSFAVASVVVGVLALPFMCIPGVGPALSVLALFLAGIGFIVGVMRGGTGLGYAVCGGLVGCIAFVPGTLLTVGAMGGAEKGSLAAQKARQDAIKRDVKNVAPSGEP